MKTWIKVVLSIVLTLVLLIGGFVSYVLWINRDIPIERPPVAEEEVLAPFELKREVYGDPDSFDQPRIQFSWRGPNRELPEIWSVKIDGTDLRLAVDADLLYQGQDLGLQPGFNTYRSPDNRYILVILGKYRVSYSAIYIIDLKEQSNKKIEDTDDAYLIRYPWVADSKSFFYLRDETSALSRYYLTTEKIEMIRETFSNKQYVQQTDEIINEIIGNDLIRWDFKGNELERIDLGKNIHQSTHYVNPDGSYYIYQNYEGTYFVPMNDFNSAEKIKVGTPIINFNHDKVFDSATTGIAYYDTLLKNKTIFFKKYGGNQYNTETGFQMRNFSLFNERINNVK